MNQLLLLSLGAALVAACALILRMARARLALSRAKHRSLAGHARWSRRFAALVPYYEYGPHEFFCIDGAPPEVAARRAQGLRALSSQLQDNYKLSRELTARLEPAVPDLAFTAAYRVPFQFRAVMARHVRLGAFATRSRGPLLQDPDGNDAYDLAGSYGVNVFGYEFYKSCIAAGVRRAADLGPVLGPYHPDVAYNVERLCEISGHEAVSFHMSGTEAVMQAVRLARYHTRRRKLVRFCGAYHGWWGEVQPGVGNPEPAPHTFTLKEMDDATLHVLRTRRDIACVLVNPLQALHPNAPAPGDGSLVDGARRAHFDREAYGSWLRRLREICTARGIVLIFDEVFMGFRLAPGGAQAYFGVRADLVTYGKTVAGGLPIGLVCGRRDLTRRYRDERPADICFARGTFNAHPYVMATMAEFLERLRDPVVEALYTDLDQRWNGRAAMLNSRLREVGLPVQVANLSSVWTVCYSAPSRYHWMLQFYLRAAGLQLAWIGTGRLIFSLDLSDAEFDEICARFVAAASHMRDDGWWWSPPGVGYRRIRRQVLYEMMKAHLGPRSGT